MCVCVYIVIQTLKLKNKFTKKYFFQRKFCIVFLLNEKKFSINKRKVAPNQ